ncbi:MAG: aminoacyl-tRNA hydrolase [Proteobacteria bacterium]|nr:aminoacyl-tRNA hydrolase [Pseudomonadota bacterium]
MGETRLVLGLGNPGPRYAATRHNAGFMTVDRLAANLCLPVDRAGDFALKGQGMVRGIRIVLAKPQTFMNESGRAAAALAARFGLSGEEILVVCDDVDLPYGRIRLKPKGGDGGHNGLRSVILELGHGEFGRLRVGIGRPPPGRSMTDHVLGPFDETEATAAHDLWELAARAAETVLFSGMAETMNLFNNQRIEIRGIPGDLEGTEPPFGGPGPEKPTKGGNGNVP